MATLIPAIGSCVARMTSGKRRLAERIEQKLSDGYNPSTDEIPIMTMTVSEGLQFRIATLPGVRHMPAARADEQEAAQLMHVAATGAMQRVVIGVNGGGKFGSRISENLSIGRSSHCLLNTQNKLL